MDSLVGLASSVVASYVRVNQLPVQSVPDLLRSVHGALAALADPVSVPHQAPAVPIKKSVQDDCIVCLEDGKRLTMLKRYLWTHYKLTPEAYRKKWVLPPEYPMVAPAYARLRSAFAKKIGLGTHGASARRGKRKPK